MRILYLDTSNLKTSTCSLNDNGHVVTIHVADSVKNLVLELKQLCQNKPVDRVIWHSGPGSYTGLRVGWCIARTLALIWKCPIDTHDTKQSLGPRYTIE